MDELANGFGMAPNLLLALMVIGALLVAGSAIRLLNIAITRRGDAAGDLASLLVWWALFAVLLIALLFSPIGTLVIFGAIGMIGLHEYGRMLGGGGSRQAFRLLIVLIPVQYVAMYFLPAPAFWLVAPLGWLILAALLAMKIRGDRDFMTAWGSYALGPLLISYALSFAPQLVLLPENSNPVGGNPGWLVFLLLLTELNDIAQAIGGKFMGRRAIAPHLSPRKTWEGLACGVISTLIASIPASLILLPAVGPGIVFPGGLVWSPVWTVAAAAMAIAGYFGDLTISGIKRQAGARDSGTILLRQGGLLDRFDSLAYTGPVFYIIVYFAVN